MTISLRTTCEIWTTWSQIWTFPAKFELFNKFEIWLFTSGFNVLKGQFQISLGGRPNLMRNLKYTNDFNTLCQISNFKKSTPKGVGDLPAKRGRITTYPWASFWDPSLGPNPNPTTAASTAKHQPPSSSTRATNPKRRPPMADLTLRATTGGARPESLLPPQTARTVLALDLGTTTGWALRGYDGLITSGTASFRPGRFDGGGMRYLRFTNWLGELDRLSGPIGSIWFEEVRRHAGTDAAHVYGGLMATLTAWAELRGVPYQGVPVGTIKKFLTGRGNADKLAMIAAARARGFSPADDNEADAIAILLWALETHGGAR